MKKISKYFSFVLPVLLIASFLFTNVHEVSAATILSESFGTGSTNSGVSGIGWSEGGNSGDDAELRASGSGNDSASPNGGRFAVMFGEDGYICRTIDASDYENLTMSYHWRGDSDAENDDDGILEYKAGGGNCSTGSWPDLQNHDLSVDSSWSTQTTFSLPDSLDDSIFNIRFRVSSSQDDEHFRVDGVVIEGDLIVEKTDPTLSVTNSPATYNGSAQSATITGSVAGVVSDVKYNGDSTVPTNAGTYAVTADFVPTDTTNYNNLNDASAGNFVINKADANIDVDGFSGSYDGLPHGMTGTVTGVLDEALAGLVLDPATFTNVSVNSLNWTFTDVTGNYNNSNGTVDIEILPLELTAVATGINKIYNGNTDADVILGAEGIIEGDDVTLSYTLASFEDPEVGADKPVTVTDIVLGGADAMNYSLSSTTANTTASISPEAANISLSGDTSVIYDGNEHELEATTDPDDLDFVILYNGLTNKPKNAGEYNVLAIITDSNYAGQDTGTLTISPLGITVKTDAGQGKVYGEVDPQLTYEITSENQLINDDELSGSLVREVGENVGEYDINQGTLNNTNYDINFIGEIFTITKADQTIDFSELGDKTIGEPDFELNANASSGLSVEFNVEDGSSCELIGENYDVVHLLAIGTCTITAHQKGDANYNPAIPVTRSFEIAPVTFIITASAGENGSITPSGSVSVAEGSSQVFIINPNGNFIVSDVVVDDVSVGAVTSYTFSEVSGNHTINATFVEAPASTSGSRATRGTTGSVLGASTEGNVLGDEKFIFTEYMKRGSVGGQVDELQKFLNDAGYSCGPVDGIFGPLTEACVRAFQTANPPLKVDGIVGPLTREVLNK